MKLVVWEVELKWLLVGVGCNCVALQIRRAEMRYSPNSQRSFGRIGAEHRRSLVAVML